METYKKLLQEKRQQLSDSIKNNIDPQMAHSVSVVDPLDFAANETNKNVMSELKNKDLTTIVKIEKALTKIQTGIFGACESCDEEIEGKRLTAQPWAVNCLVCQEADDNRGKRFATFKTTSINPITLEEDNEGKVS